MKIALNNPNNCEFIDVEVGETFLYLKQNILFQKTYYCQMGPPEDKYGFNAINLQYKEAGIDFPIICLFTNHDSVRKVNGCFVEGDPDQINALLKRMREIDDED